MWERPPRCFCSRKRVSRPVPALFPLLSPRCLDDLNIFPLIYFQVRLYMSFILSTELLRHKTYPAVCLCSQGYCLTKMTPKFVFSKLILVHLYISSNSNTYCKLCELKSYTNLQNNATLTSLLLAYLNFKPILAAWRSDKSGAAAEL